MAKVAVAPRMENLAGIGAQERALARFEKQENAAEAALQRRTSNGILRRAIKAWRAGDIVRAGRLALDATGADDSNAQAYHVLAMALERMGHLHKALVTYERAFELDPDDPDLFINLGLTAWSLKLIDGAMDMFCRFIAARPDSPLGYNNLGTILCEKGEAEAAIDVLRNAIFRMPGESVLWNSIATVLAETGRAEESIVFYEEAIRLSPAIARPWHNLGFAYSHLGRLEEALAAYDNALARAVDPTEVMEGRHSRGVCLIGMGRLEEGFREYEIRNSPRFRAHVHHMLKAPRWNGEPLEGKRLLLVGEQGLGDEIMFANIVPDVIEAVGSGGKLQIAVDPRLVGVFARSFPEAEVGAYDDRRLVGRDGAREIRFVPWAVADGEPDYFAAMGTPLQHFRTQLEDFPGRAYIVPNPERVSHFRDRLRRLGEGPSVGICWRSMMLDAKRRKYFGTLDDWTPLLQTPGVQFVNFQYGDCHEEIAQLRALHGVKIAEFEDLDLKNDIEGAVALGAALDLLVTAPTAAAAEAGSTGTEVWLLTAGRTWPQLGTDRYPWYKNTRVLSPEKFGDWPSLMPQVGERLAAFAEKFSNG